MATSKPTTGIAMCGFPQHFMQAQFFLGDLAVGDIDQDGKRTGFAAPAGIFTDKMASDRPASASPEP